MKIWKEIFARWLGWTLGGALFGCLAGAVVGGIHGAVYASVFERGTFNSGQISTVEGFVFGAGFAVVEGAICGALAFCIASLLRLKSPHLLSLRHFKKTMGAAFVLCVLGSVAGALTAMAGAFLWARGIASQFDIGQGYFYGCQIGFNLGLFCGVLSPGAVEKAREAVKSLFAFAVRRS